MHRNIGLLRFLAAAFFGLVSLGLGFVATFFLAAVLVVDSAFGFVVDFVVEFVD